MSVDFDNLIEPAREGDPRAIGQLVEMYRNYVELLARPQIRGRLAQKVSPSDVAQDTFLQVKRGIVAFRGTTEAEFIAWLRKILANRLAELIRHYGTQQRDILLEVDLQHDFDQSSADLGLVVKSQLAGPRSNAIHQEETVLLANALARLPRDYRDVLTLRHVEGLGFAQVAKEMGRSVDSVKNIWARAIAGLRNQLEEASR